MVEVRKRAGAPQKGPGKWVSRENCQKKCRRTFWHFLMIFDVFALREKCRKVSKIVLTLFGNFWRFLTWPLCAAPFCGPPRYFRNGHFEFQCEERHTFFRGLAGRPFLSEGSSLFLPFLFLTGGFLGTFHGFSKYPFAKYPFASFWNSQVNFVGDVLVDLLGPFSLEKAAGQIPPQNPQQNSNQNLGVSRPKSTLQGSGLDTLGVRRPFSEQLSDLHSRPESDTKGQFWKQFSERLPELVGSHRFQPTFLERFFQNWGGPACPRESWSRFRYWEHQKS